ncbi:hypothetical protein [Paenibacillus xylaniclasticus]|uniref:hypothetical protein n=1 Tax=Paenibacillus xylaniclasticus TaxID=588083 RepID=UPI000FD71ED9|nr:MULTISPECIES: hypothetical protein [Paenibacillus]GFN32916.1 hypothetical protein PCURB6_31760 [Paenibacillus curdlanolyticus]
MNNSKRAFVTLLTIVIFALTAVAVSAGPIAGGDLWYDGGQTGTYVYSSVYDHKPDDNKYYDVKASVKVCSSVTTSGWLPDSAYASADRSFWCNETSYYDYRSR